MMEKPSRYGRDAAHDRDASHARPTSQAHSLTGSPRESDRGSPREFNDKLPHSTSLPPAAAKQLKQAAQTPNTARDPLAKQKAIETATAKIRREYPHYFRVEQE